MGYREWRERQLARADAMVARADARAVAAKERERRVAGEQDAARAARLEDATAAWWQGRAATLGEDHEDLVARAAVFGMAPPSPDRDLPSAVRRLGAIGELLVPVGGDAGGDRVDAYEAWRDRIALEELAAGKAARGQALTRGERVALRLARAGSR